MVIRRGMFLLPLALALTTIMALRTFDLIYVATAGGPGTSTSAR